jgi:hypothetical protein
MSWSITEERSEQTAAHEAESESWTAVRSFKAVTAATAMAEAWLKRATR